LSVSTVAQKGGMFILTFTSYLLNQIFKFRDPYLYCFGNALHNSSKKILG